MTKMLKTSSGQPALAPPPPLNHLVAASPSAAISIDAADLARLRALLAALAGEDEPAPVIEGSALEAVHGPFRWRPVATWGLPLMGACFAVARIDFKGGQHNGTGFLVTAASLGLPLSGLVLVTCNHVVCDPARPGATAYLKDRKNPARMTVSFELRQPAVTYSCTVIWQSPVHELDITILRLDPAPLEAPRYDFAASALQLADGDPAEFIAVPHGKRRQRLYPLHHPGGDPIAWSHEDCAYLGAKARPGTAGPIFLHYRCPTATGSSGAPVLDEELRVVAVHRAGAETMHDGESPVGPRSRVNEGVSIQSLRAAIASTPERFVRPRRKWHIW